MQTIRTHVAGVDVHRDLLVITVLIGDADKPAAVETWECPTFTTDLKNSAQKLLQLKVKHVAMESTGIYWKPVYNVWAKMGLEITLGNAQHIRNVPGRKTDYSDSYWLAELHRYGLIRASYIPDDEFQHLRSLTRQRSHLISDITRVKNRVQKVLEDGNIKLKSVLSDVFGVGAIKALAAIAEGKTNAVELASLIDTSIKAEQEEVIKALTNCLSVTHCQQIKLLLRQYRELNSITSDLEKEITGRIQKYQNILKRIDQIPGVSLRSAQILLAESTTRMDLFASDRHFAAWAGVSPGNHQSAKKKKRAKKRHGNPNLSKALFQVARAAVLKKGTYLHAKYNKLIFQTGSKMKALVAIANRIARTLYHMIKNADLNYKDIGPSRVESYEQQIKRRIGQLKRLGVNVVYQGEVNTVTVLTSS